MSSLLFLVSAPSGAGKTSLVKAALAQDEGLKVSVSHTTRAIRPGEVDGQNYHFVSREVFESMVAANEFLEYATVFGNYYGTSKAEVARLHEQNCDVILEIDWQGAEQVRTLEPAVISVFILPPNVQALEDRLNGRGQDAPDVIAKRLAEARLDMSKASAFDYIVVNDDFDTALADLLAIVRAARLGCASQQNNPAIVQMTGHS